MYIGTKPQSGFITTAKQRVTSSTNNYVDLDHSISSLADVIVWVNFVKQDSTNLSLTTSTRITLGGTLVSSDIVEIAYLGKAVATQNPSTNSITNDMLVGSIANDKLAGSIANSKLANSSITLNGSAVSLGGSATVGGTNTALFKAYYTGNGSISALAVTKLVFNNEHFDSNNVYNTSTGKFTAPEAGTYFFLTQFYVGTALSTLQVRLYKNGSALETIGFSGSGAGAVTGSSILSLAQNDYIEIYARSNDGNTIYGSTVSGELTRFEGYKLIT